MCEAGIWYFRVPYGREAWRWDRDGAGDGTRECVRWAMIWREKRDGHALEPCESVEKCSDSKGAWRWGKCY